MHLTCQLAIYFNNSTFPGSNWTLWDLKSLSNDKTLFSHSSHTSNSPTNCAVPMSCKTKIVEMKCWIWTKAILCQNLYITNEVVCKQWAFDCVRTSKRKKLDAHKETNERTNSHLHTHTTEIIDAEAGHRGVDDSPLDSRNFRVFRL